MNGKNGIKTLDILRYGITLMVITALSSGILSFVYEATETKRKEILEREKRSALADVLPGSSVFRERNGYFEGYASDDAKEAPGMLL